MGETYADVDKELIPNCPCEWDGEFIYMILSGTPQKFSIAERKFV